MKHLLKMKRLLKPAGIAVTVLALLASVVAGRERPATVAAEPAARIDSRVQLGELDLSKLERAAPGTAPAADPFAPKSFAPPQAQQSATPAKPQAPELPFRYLGKLIEDGKLSVFLANGAESLTVTAGAKIGDYRVDKVTESEIQFTYLPLKTKQSLPL
ncbi:MAG: hypothetical protein QOD26_3516 [Betaproteobacteria bacterium]|nr:hypothetical protein [Betaproteobacteria bacterium]